MTPDVRARLREAATREGPAYSWEELEDMLGQALDLADRYEAALERIRYSPHHLTCPTLSRQHPDRDFWQDGDCQCPRTIAREAMKKINNGT